MSCCLKYRILSWNLKQICFFGHGLTELMQFFLHLSWGTSVRKRSRVRHEKFRKSYIMLFLQTYSVSRNGIFPNPQSIISILYSRFINQHLKNECINKKLTFLRYDPEQDVWVEIASLRIAREYCDATVFNKKMYIIGGRPAGISCEVYNPDHDRFSDVSYTFSEKKYKRRRNSKFLVS